MHTVPQFQEKLIFTKCTIYDHEQWRLKSKDVFGGSKRVHMSSDYMLLVDSGKNGTNKRNMQSYESKKQRMPVICLPVIVTP